MSNNKRTICTHELDANVINADKVNAKEIVNSHDSNTLRTKELVCTGQAVLNEGSLHKFLFTELSGKTLDARSAAFTKVTCTNDCTVGNDLSAKNLTIEYIKTNQMFFTDLLICPTKSYNQYDDSIEDYKSVEVPSSIFCGVVKEKRDVIKECDDHYVPSYKLWYDNLAPIDNLIEDQKITGKDIFDVVKDCISIVDNVLEIVAKLI